MGCEISKESNLEILKNCEQWGFFNYAREVPYNKAVIKKCCEYIKKYDEQPKIEIHNADKISLKYKNSIIMIHGKRGNLDYVSGISETLETE